MSNNDNGQTVWGEIIETSDGQTIINNPVPVKHSMSSAERTRRAMALKLAGASYAQIALNLGYHDASGARKAVQRGMKNALQETSTELKKIHYGRLEHMLMLLWADVNNRDLSSMNTALAVMDRMERLYGLNAAEKLDINAGTSHTVILADGDKESYINALREAGKRLAIDVSSSTPEDDEEDEDTNEHYTQDTEQESDSEQY